MKLKRPKLHGPTAYLGRFAQPKHLNRGHNSDGISAQSRRAIRELDRNDAPPPPAPEAAPDMSRARGGPSPSKELLDRVEAERKRRGEESFRRLMEKRRREGN